MIYIDTQFHVYLLSYCHTWDACGCVYRLTSYHILSVVLHLPTSPACGFDLNTPLKAYFMPGITMYHLVPVGKSLTPHYSENCIHTYMR